MLTIALRGKLPYRVTCFLLLREYRCPLTFSHLPMKYSFADLRQEYIAQPLQKRDLSPNPFEQFATWFAQAQKAKIPEPNAMSVGTVSPEGQPSQRIVLLKYFSESGFVFFTNYTSRKAQEIAQNARVSLLFPWFAMARQVEIQGKAEKISALDSARYFFKRPRESQIGAWVSEQSTVISSAQILREKFAAMQKKFKEKEIPLPDAWGGYRVVPQHMEFWQGGANRLHDRFLYSKEAEQSDKSIWRIQRLAP